MPLIAGSAHDAARRADGLDAIRACPTPKPGSDGTHPTRPRSDRPSHQQRTGHRDTGGLGYPGGVGNPGGTRSPGDRQPTSGQSGHRGPGGATTAGR